MKIFALIPVVIIAAALLFFLIDVLQHSFRKDRCRALGKLFLIFFISFLEASITIMAVVWFVWGFIYTFSF